MSNNRFIHPRFWPTWAGYGFLWCVVRLPHGLRLAVGSFLGRLGYVLAAGRRRIVESNLAACFPDLDHDEVRQLAHDTFRSGGMSIVETAIAWLGKSGSVHKICRINGLEHLTDAVDRGKGVILLGTHMSTLDIAGSVLSSHVAFDVMYRANKNPLLERIMTGGRERLYPHAIERNDVRRVIGNLKAGHVVWYGPDQDYGERNSVFVPFFGVPAATMTAVSRIAAMTGSPVVPFSHYRVAGGYEIDLGPELDDFPSGSLQADARRINALVESYVKRYPEQYWWFHRRFKTRPAGENSIY